MMLNKMAELNYYEFLEVAPGANATEIRKACERMRMIYDPNSMAIYSLFSRGEIEQLRQRIAEAHGTLTSAEKREKYDASLGKLPGTAAGTGRDHGPDSARPQPPVSPESCRENPRTSPPAARQEDSVSVPPVSDRLRPVPASIGEFSGTALRSLREQRNLSIRNIADITKVSTRYLEYIEEEKFQLLPVRPYLRGYLTLYAKALAYEPDRIVHDYLQRYEAAMAEPARQ